MYYKYIVKQFDMKQLLFIVCCCCVFSSFAITPNTKQPRAKYSTKKVYEPAYDSAYIYYTKGWESYKAQDFGAARYYWERGANCNSNIPSRYSSAFRLALMHQNGEGVGVNNEIAFYYYNLAYANGKSVGNVDATKNIASYYESGIVVAQDNRKALEWYLKAKRQGNKYCDEDIARVRQKIAQNL